MLALYGAFADEAAIVAYSLAHSVSLIVLRLPIGLACWPALASAAAARPGARRTEARADSAKTGIRLRARK